MVAGSRKEEVHTVLWRRVHVLGREDEASVKAIAIWADYYQVQPEVLSLIAKIISIRAKCSGR